MSRRVSCKLLVDNEPIYVLSHELPFITIIEIGFIRFQGSHTGQAISDCFEEICAGYAVLDKLDTITTNNAANMKRAFTVCFPESEEARLVGEVGTTDSVDNEAFWCDAEFGEVNEIRDIVSRAGTKSTWHRCFAHSLQLVIGDSIKHSKSISGAVSKCCSISTKLHSSTVLREAFEMEFSANASVPADVCTRWNSTLRQISCILRLAMMKINKVLKDHSPNLVFSVKEWTQLTELAHILYPFAQATDYTQGEKIVTSSYVVPCLAGLLRHTHTHR